jgi:hypothetical protein
MNKRNLLKRGILAMAVMAMAISLPSASASVMGHLVVGICAGGGVNVSLGIIDWSPGSPTACLQVGSGTNITSVGSGSLSGASPAGTINDLPPASGIFGFMTFGSLMFDLAPVNGFGTGVGIACTSGMGIGSSCSVPGSPFVLTNLGTATAVSLPAHGTISDTVGPVSSWEGAFTTQINGITPIAIQDNILAGGTISSSFSGEFDVTVPEPVSMGLVGASLIALAVFTKRRQRV